MRRVPASVGLALITAGLALGTWAVASRGSGEGKVHARDMSATAHVASTPVVPAALGVAVSPQPATDTANPDTQISFLGVPASSIRDVRVHGSISGNHAGRLAAYASRPGASFLPSKVGFQPNDHVSVSAQIRSRGVWRPVAFSFTVSTPVSIPKNPLGKALPAKPGTVQAFQTRPDLQPPTVSVGTNNAGASSGDIFLAPIGGPGAHGPMILDSSGRLVYFHPVTGAAVMDFKPQQYEGKTVLTWWQGFISSLGLGWGERKIVDSNYRQIATVQAGNGYLSDLHDFQLLPDGSALLTAYAPERRDLSFAGGARSGVVLDGVVQQIDVKTGLVMFEWHAMQRAGIRDSYLPVPRTSAPYDFFHVNSVGVDKDGSLLISARNTWAGYSVNPVTGSINWILGGKRSTFKMGSGAQFSWQHDIRRQPDGTISVFDDGALPKVESQSRGEILKLDVQHHTAVVARQVTHPTSPLLAGSQGNLQLLPNGDAFVGWGAVNYMSEFSPSGHLVFDASLPAPGESYRAFRGGWSATPPGSPSVKVVSGTGASRTTVYASWNGATGVARWRLLSGASPDLTHMSNAGEAASSGFETAITATGGGQYFAVQALDSGGNVLRTSAAVA